MSRRESELASPVKVKVKSRGETSRGRKQKGRGGPGEGDSGGRPNLRRERWRRRRRRFLHACKPRCCSGIRGGRSWTNRIQKTRLSLSGDQKTRTTPTPTGTRYPTTTGLRCWPSRYHIRLLGSWTKPTGHENDLLRVSTCCIADTCGAPNRHRKDDIQARGFKHSLDTSTTTSQQRPSNHHVIPPPSKTSRHSSSSFRKRSSWWHWLIAYWLVSQTFVYLVPVSSAVQAASLSSRILRDRVLPPPPNSSILIQFTPPAILNLRVRTRQIVFFNFTLYPHTNKFRNVFNPNASYRNSGSGSTSNNAKSKNRNISSHVSNDVADSLTVSTTPPPTTTTATTATPSSAPTTTFPNINGSFFTASSSSSSPLASSLSSFSSSTTTAAASPASSPPSLSASTQASSSRHVESLVQPSDGAKKKKKKRSSYLVMIESSDDNIASPVLPTFGARLREDPISGRRCILMAVTADRQHNFSVEARHIGRATMSVAVVDVGAERALPQTTVIYSTPQTNFQAVASTEYPVTAVREERTADIAFNSVAAAIAFIIAFGMGASTDMDSLKRQFKSPVALVIGFCCQFVLMPVMAFGLAMSLPLEKDIRFGLLCVACVPGGGVGHVAVIIADGDTALSLSINIISVVAMLGTAPLWIFILGQYFLSESDEALNSRNVPVWSIEIWLAASFLAYVIGLVIKQVRPNVADAILMWLIKPFLLLASILYITLGVYINMYVFELVNEYALLGAMLLPLCGCVLGGLTAAICRQSYSFIKTIALETSSLNCLVMMVALRFSLQQPDADLASMIPIWVMFTIPGLFVFLALVNKIKNVILHYWRNRHGGSSGNNNSKDAADLLGSSKAYSVSSSVVSPPGTTTLSAPLVVADGIDDDMTVSTSSNQKVTVL